MQIKSKQSLWTWWCDGGVDDHDGIVLYVFARSKVSFVRHVEIYENNNSNNDRDLEAIGVATTQSVR